MKDRTTAPAAYDDVTLAAFQALPRRRPLAEYAPLEARAVRMEGWVQRQLRAADGDIHLELAPGTRVPGGPDTLYVTAEVTPGWQRRFAGWDYAGLLAAFRPNAGDATTYEQGPRRVRLGGWLLYDFQHDPPDAGAAPAAGAVRASGWEIHPVTSIEVWDEADGVWREWRR
jgi:hypothetical protein